MKKKRREKQRASVGMIREKGRKMRDIGVNVFCYLIVALLFLAPFSHAGKHGFFETICSSFASKLSFSVSSVIKIGSFNRTIEVTPVRPQ